MRLQVRSTQNQGIPTASMADIAFLLIIFFMVTINFEVDKTQVLLPKAAVRLEIPKKSAYISITETGQIRVSAGDEISVPVPGPQDVLSFASSVVMSDPSRAFVLKADALTRGSGVVIGDQVSPETWLEAMEQTRANHGVAQLKCHLPSRTGYQVDTAGKVTSVAEFYGVDVFYFGAQFGLIGIGLFLVHHPAARTRHSEPSAQPAPD